MFQYKGNYCVVIRAEKEYVYAIDVEYDVEYDDLLIHKKLTYGEIEEDINEENIGLGLFEKYENK